MSHVAPSTLATVTDLANLIQPDDVPANGPRLLRSATRMVLDATSTAYYDTDPTTGLPVEDWVAAALNEATCIQAAAWIALDYDPMLGGVVTSDVEQSVGIGSGRIVYEDAAVAAQARADAISGLVPEAVQVLTQAHLIQTRVWVYG